MARRGAKGKGWIRLMRVIVWVLAVIMFVGGVAIGIAAMNAPELTQADLGRIGQAQSGNTIVYFTLTGEGAGIAVMVFMTVIAVIFLASMNVYLDMAENVRRIAGKLSRRSMQIDDEWPMQGAGRAPALPVERRKICSLPTGAQFRLKRPAFCCAPCALQTRRICFTTGRATRKWPAI